MKNSFLKKDAAVCLKQLAELFTVFFKIGAITFGGGLAMLPLLRREVVEKKQWATDEEMLDYFAIGQSTPGVIAINVATFTGYKVRGVFGSIIATAAIILPSLIIITIIAALTSTENVRNIAALQKVLSGINVAVAALLLSALIDLGKKTVVDGVTLCIAIGSFIAMRIFSISAVWIVLCGAIVGIAVKVIKEKYRANR